MTRTLTLFAAFLFVMSSALSFGQEKKAAPAWKEKNEFHEVMAKTFHPAEEGNLEPLKKYSGELVSKATAWAKSTPPANVDKEVSLKVKALAEQATALDKQVKANASTDELMAGITALHNSFHEIAGMCTPGDKAKESHEGHEHDGHSHEGHNH